jgi:putative ABC transport system permease protein
MRSYKLAWSQLMREKKRLAAALAGISFAVLLMLMQLGFRDALFSSATMLHNNLNADLFIVNSQYDYIASPQSFSRRLLYRGLGFDGVQSVTPFYLGLTIWKNPITAKGRNIFVIAFDPTPGLFDFSGVDENLDKLKLPDAVLFDSASNPNFGPIPDWVKNGHDVRVEINNQRVHVVGMFKMGASFSADGNLITSDVNFLRIFSGRDPGLIDVGAIKLKPGADPIAIRNGMQAELGKSVLVLTKPEFIGLENKFWSVNSPIGVLFNTGAFMGFVVGAIIVYQILYTDVSDHMAEYATLKAIGYKDGYLIGIVMSEALILAILGFLPGYFITVGIYASAQSATNLPIFMTAGRAALVSTLTIGMCCVSGGLAMRKLQSADPAEIF